MKPIFTISFCIILLVTIVADAFSQPQTITLRPGPTDGKGAELSDYSPNTNAGDSPWFDANAWTAGGDSLHIRSLMQIDLTSVPANAIILSAKLSLYCNPASTHYQLQAGDNQSYLLRVTEPWDDATVTWNSQPAISMENPVLIPTSVTMVQDYPDIDVTTHVQAMVSDPEHNYGWEIRLVTEYLYRSMQLSSCHDAFQYRPSLEITYLICDPPTANWSYVLEEGQVHFTDASSPGVQMWTWDFGDGNLSNMQNPVHIYPAYGKYYVCLEVTDSCGTASFCDTVNYCPPLNADFSHSVNNLTVTFQDLTTASDTWLWDFGDGFLSSVQNPVHTFNALGHYYVCLTAGNNCTSQTVCDSVFVETNGIEEPTDSKLLVYPIPANTKLFVSSEAPDNGVVDLYVMDITGAVITKKEVFFKTPGTKYEIDLTNFAAGSYILKAVWGDKVMVKKFIVFR